MQKETVTTPVQAGTYHGLSMREPKLRRWIHLNIYCRHIYRHHMRFIHRFGWHWFTRMWPSEGQPQKWCQWCGERHIIYPSIIFAKGQPQTIQFSQMQNPNSWSEPCQTSKQ